MKLYRVAINEIFIVATGLAAFFHSTWSLGTLFSGVQPDPASDGVIRYVLWLGPAALIAFALDIGQIMTSHHIRSGERTRARYATFIVLAFSTYYLQWLYIAHHMPLLTLAPGVMESWGGVAPSVRDLAIWIFPGLLPLSTILYTLSAKAPVTPALPAAPVPTVESSALVPVATVIEVTEPDDPKIASCPYCDWLNEYETPGKARTALAAHVRQIHADSVRETLETANGRYK